MPAAKPSGFQITVDCADPNRMALFWSVALAGYELPAVPEGHASWREFWLSVGVPEDEVGEGYDAVVDAAGGGPRIWFRQVPEPKAAKNRLHFDILIGGGRSVPIDERKRRVRAEAARLATAGATERHVMDLPEVDHFAIAMADPEGNEFDVV